MSQPKKLEDYTNMKKKSISSLKKKFWIVFSKYIKARDKNICFTCGRYGEGSGMHSGHFIPKAAGGLALYFNEDNVHAQCYNCNINLFGRQYEYGQLLGEEKVKELYKIKNENWKWDINDYENKIEEYQNKLELL